MSAEWLSGFTLGVFATLGGIAAMLVITYLTDRNRSRQRFLRKAHEVAVLKTLGIAMPEDFTELNRLHAIAQAEHPRSIIKREPAARGRKPVQEE